MCVAANDPSRFEDVNARFGDDARCWDEGASGRRICEEACANELFSCEGRDEPFDTGRGPDVFFDWREDGGSTTLFSAAQEASITSMVTFDDASCLAFGNSPEYYASFGCSQP